MLEQFLNHELHIKLTKSDIPMLTELQNKVKVVFCSKDALDSDYTKGLIERCEVIYIIARDNSVCYTEFEPESHDYVTLKEFLDYKEFELDSTEIDLIFSE